MWRGGEDTNAPHSAERDVELDDRHIVWAARRREAAQLRPGCTGCARGEE